MAIEIESNKCKFWKRKTFFKAVLFLLTILAINIFIILKGNILGSEAKWANRRINASVVNMFLVNQTLTDFHCFILRVGLRLVRAAAPEIRVAFLMQYVVLIITI